MTKNAVTMPGRNRITRRALNGAGAALLLGLAGCAEFGSSAAPIMPPAPPPPSPERVAAAEALMGDAYRFACVQTPIDLTGADAQLIALGFQPLAPNESFPRFGRGDVIVELRLGNVRPVEASNCLVSSAVVTEKPARRAGQSALAGVPNAVLLTPEQARELTPQGGAFGLVEADAFDGVASVYETIQQDAIVSILSMIKTR